MSKPAAYTALNEVLGVELPILQAPIGSVAGVDLAAAVSNAGGLGALALTWTAPEATGELVAAMRRKTSRPFQVNFVLAFACPSLVPALEAGARIVTFSWGLPSAEVDVVKSFGAKLGIQVSTSEGALRALDAGADFLICQGVEAGGHVQATRSLWKVLSEVLDAAAGVPIVAAGGIGSGAAIRRVLEMGASGAMLGTRFVATKESLAHEAYKQRLVSAETDDSALTVCFDLTWPNATHRVLRSPTLDAWEAAGCPPFGKRPGEGETVAIRVDGTPCIRYDDVPPLFDMSGALEELCLFAGTGCGEITDVPPAADLVERLWHEASNY